MLYKEYPLISNSEGIVSLKIDSSIRFEISAAPVSELEWGSQAEDSAGSLHMQHGRLKRMLGAMPWLFGSAKAR